MLVYEYKVGSAKKVNTVSLGIILNCKQPIVYINGRLQK
jgi:hypothetical protein